MTFTNEAEFEKALIKVLRDKGWGEHDVIKNPTEEQLLENWAKILFENNTSIDRLNNTPLTHSEMQQILEQINILKTPEEDVWKAYCKVKGYYEELIKKWY